MAIVFPNGTQSGAVLQTRQNVFNDAAQINTVGGTWVSFGFEPNITPTSSNSYIRFEFVIPMAAMNYINSTVRVARSIGGGSWTEVSGNLQTNWGVTRPRGQHMSIYSLGGNWSNTMNIVMHGIDNPGTTSQVKYRAELATDSTNNTFFVGFNYNNSQTGDAYSKAPSIVILEELDPSLVSSLDAL